MKSALVFFIVTLIAVTSAIPAEESGAVGGKWTREQVLEHVDNMVPSTVTCVNVHCRMSCLKSGAVSGYCAAGGCICVKPTEEPVAVEEKWTREQVLEHLDNVIPSATCLNVHCRMSCLKSGAVSGYCAAGSCTCVRPTEEPVAVGGKWTREQVNEHLNNVIPSYVTCVNVRCRMSCLQSGAVSGYCAAGACNCVVPGPPGV